MTSLRPIAPGSTLGVLGSGQLGRMFALEAIAMGYRVHVFSPDASSPTGQVAQREIAAPYEDLDAVRSFARNVDAVTFEFENVPLPTAQAAQEHAFVRPNPELLHTAQHRSREKSFLQSSGFPVTEFVVVRSVAELTRATQSIGAPCVAKTASFGYDGKGQTRIHRPEDAERAWQALWTDEVVLEKEVDFQAELSVVVARDRQGEIRAYGPMHNVHRNHILDVSSTAGDVFSEAVQKRALELSAELAQSVALEGVLCVEMFLTPGHELLVNEIAPRPHNSGHLTLEAFETSQFQQQVRGLCGLPLGSDGLLQPAAMANLLGEVWAKGEPDWSAALQDEHVKLHLYGKQEARPARKMGHLTALGTTREQAIERVEAARGRLQRR